MSSEGEDRFKQRTGHFINLGWGIITVIILVVFVREVKLFTATDLTRLKMRSNLLTLRK